MLQFAEQGFSSTLGIRGKKGGGGRSTKEGEGMTGCFSNRGKDQLQGLGKDKRMP